MENIIEYIGGGLKCDNTKCDWEDETIPYEDYPNQINRACPKCGENILTLEDYNNTKLVFDTVAIVNSMSKEELKAIGIDVENTTGEKVVATLNTHKTIDIIDIKPTKD